MTSNIKLSSEQKELIEWILGDLMVYDGGEMQSMNEWSSCVFMNQRIKEYAHDLGIDLSQVDTGACD